MALAGNYRLDTEALNFAGTMRLDAPLSRTTTGVRSFLLRAFDPFFRRPGAGTQLTITVGGTVDTPRFGLDLKRTLTDRQPEAAAGLGRVIPPACWKGIQPPGLQFAPATGGRTLSVSVAAVLIRVIEGRRAV